MTGGGGGWNYPKDSSVSEGSSYIEGCDHGGGTLFCRLILSCEGWLRMEKTESDPLSHVVENTLSCSDVTPARKALWHGYIAE